MAYNQFNPALPNGGAPDNQNGAAVLQSVRNNQKALRDMLIAGAAVGWNGALVTAAFTATCSGTALTVSAVSAGQICPGMTVYVAGVAKGKVVSQSSGATFGAGAYVLDTANTYSTGTAMTAASANTDLPAAEGASFGTTEKLLVVLAYDATPNCTSEKYYYWNSTSGVWDLMGTNTLAYDGLGNYLNNTWS